MAISQETLGSSDFVTFDLDIVIMDHTMSRKNLELIHERDYNSRLNKGMNYPIKMVWIYGALA